MKELEDEWAKLPGDPAVPLRVLRSQQQSQAAAVVTSGGGGGDSVGGGATGGVAVVEALDPFELFEPVDMLSQMPKDFFEKVVRTCTCRSWWTHPQTSPRGRSQWSHPQTSPCGRSLSNICHLVEATCTCSGLTPPPPPPHTHTQGCGKMVRT